MSERAALLLAGCAHLALLAALSAGLARSLPDAAPSDVTPIEFLEIGPEATVDRPPEPVAASAPRDAGVPPAPDSVEPVALPQPAADVLEPAIADTTAQDALPLEPAPPAPVPSKAVAKPGPARPATARPGFDPGQLAALIDKSIPQGPARPRDTSVFAKSIEQAIPKGLRVSPRAMATLEQAIRSQVAPCWNPPIGGADVAEMTAVLRIRLNRDGTVAAPPEFVSQTGATAANQAYARAFVETARRAVLRCTPLQLPDDLYVHWREFELNFDPRLMT